MINSFFLALSFSPKSLFYGLIWVWYLVYMYNFISRYFMLTSIKRLSLRSKILIWFIQMIGCIIDTTPKLFLKQIMTSVIHVHFAKNDLNWCLVIHQLLINNNNYSVFKFIITTDVWLFINWWLLLITKNHIIEQLIIIIIIIYLLPYK